MYRFYLLLLLLLTGTVAAFCQAGEDTLSAGVTRLAADTTVAPAGDSAMVQQDSLPRRVPRPLLKIAYWEPVQGIPDDYEIRQRHPFYAFSQKAVAVHTDIKLFRGKEVLFYTIAALCLLFALLKTVFAKYFTDLFRVFFRTTMKQRQIRDQLMQTPLPSLLFNLFFILSAGLYLVFMFRYFDISIIENEWWLYLYCCAGLAVIYIVKFIGLKLTGWIFNMKAATESYTFIVFIVNKLIGTFLLPFLVLLAFTTDPVYSVAIILSWAGLALLYFYRFILGFGVVRNEVKLNIFHFLLYLVAFEIIPLLLIYKLLLLFFK